MPLSPGDTLSGHYRIEAEIGRGAYGRVYRAHDTKLDRPVAIKELAKGADDLGSSQFADYVRRFEREARVQAGFNHPNIVHVYELIQESRDRLYQVMEFVDGESLRDHLSQRGSLPIDEAVRIAADLLACLAAVHADPRDIVHRDVKPSNVLLTKDGQAKLADFGLAQVGDESLRSEGGKPHPGTALYMSPEQETTSAYLYPASDIFSVGCVLFEMLTGVPYKRAKKERKRLADLRPEIPPWLAGVLATALAENPAARYSRSDEMAAALAKQASTPGKVVGKPISRRTLFATASGVVAMGIIAWALIRSIVVPSLVHIEPTAQPTRVVVPDATTAVVSPTTLTALPIAPARAPTELPAATPSLTPTVGLPSTTPTPSVTRPSTGGMAATPTPNASPTPLSTAPLKPTTVSTAIPATSLPAPRQVSPVDGETAYGKVELSWEPVSGSARYLLQTRSDRAGQSEWRSWGPYSVETGDRAILSFSDDPAYFNTPGTVYYWRVSAQNAAGNVGAFSTERRFVYQREERPPSSGAWLARTDKGGLSMFGLMGVMGAGLALGLVCARVVDEISE